MGAAFDGLDGNHECMVERKPPIHAQLAATLTRRAKHKTISGLVTTSSRWWAELTYVGHSTEALTLARSKRGRGALLFLPRRGAYHASPPQWCAPPLRPRAVGFTTLKLW